MKFDILRFFSAVLLTTGFIACASGCESSDSDSSFHIEMQQSAQESVIEETISTVEIEGLEIKLPCAYTDLTIYPVYDESKWFAPQESHYAAEMLDQQISFKVNEKSDYSYTLYCAFPEDGDYRSGIIYSLAFSDESNSLIYKGEQYICGETTEQEIENRLGSNFDRSESGLLRNYTYKDGVVRIFITDGKLTDMIIRSTTSIE